MPHNHRVNESKKRSALKSFMGYILEVGVDTVIIGLGLSALGLGIEKAFLGGGILATITEVLCFLTHYFNERFWNKIAWGREIIDDNSNSN